MLSARQGRAIGVTEVYAPKAKGFDLIKNSYGYLVNSSKKRKNDDVAEAETRKKRRCRGDDERNSQIVF